MADFLQKRCNGCRELKSLDKFNVQEAGKFGRRGRCKACQSVYDARPERKVKRKAYYWKHRASILVMCAEKRATGQYHYPETQKRWRTSPAGRASQRKHREKNKQAINASIRRWKVQQYRTNINYRILDCLRRRLNRALHRNSKSQSTIKLLGCQIDSFKIYIESLFEPGMSWENYGYRGWHIDHIIPCALFDLSKPDQQTACFHFSNLQPMWWKENISKGGRILIKEKH